MQMGEKLIAVMTSSGDLAALSYDLSEVSIKALAKYNMLSLPCAYLKKSISNL